MKSIAKYTLYSLLMFASALNVCAQVEKLTDEKRESPRVPVVDHRKVLEPDTYMNMALEDYTRARKAENSSDYAGAVNLYATALNSLKCLQIEYPNYKAGEVEKLIKRYTMQMNDARALLDELRAAEKKQADVQRKKTPVVSPLMDQPTMGNTSTRDKKQRPNKVATQETAVESTVAPGERKTFTGDIVEQISQMKAEMDRLYTENDALRARNAQLQSVADAVQVPVEECAQLKADIQRIQAKLDAAEANLLRAEKNWRDEVQGNAALKDEIKRAAESERKLSNDHAAFVAKLKAEHDAHNAQNKRERDALALQNKDALDKQAAHYKSELDKNAAHYKAELEKNIAQCKAECDKQAAQSKAAFEKDAAQYKSELEKSAALLKTEIEKRDAQITSAQTAVAEQKSAVDILTQRKTALEKRLAELVAKASADAAQIAQLTAQIEKLQSDIRAKDEALDTLKKQINTIKKYALDSVPFAPVKQEPAPSIPAQPDSVPQLR